MIRVKLLLIWLVCLLVPVLAAGRMLYAILTSPARAWVLAISFDQLFNATLNGNPDETLSSRAYRASLKGRRWGCVLCRFLDLFEEDHCKKSAGS